MNVLLTRNGHDSESYTVSTNASEMQSNQSIPCIVAPDVVRKEWIDEVEQANLMLSEFKRMRLLVDAASSSESATMGMVNTEYMPIE
jgi:hypothetical protein